MQCLLNINISYFTSSYSSETVKSILDQWYWEVRYKVVQCWINIYFSIVIDLLIHWTKVAKEFAAYLWESGQLKVLLECWIVSEVLEVECLLWTSKLLSLLLLLRLCGETGELLLLAPLWLRLLRLLLISELVQRISELWWVEECVNAVDEGLEKRAWKIKHKMNNITKNIWIYKYQVPRANILLHNLYMTVLYLLDRIPTFLNHLKSMVLWNDWIIKQ